VNLLNWSHWDLLAIQETEHAYAVAAALKARPVACVHCATVGELERFGKQHPLFADLPMHGKRVSIRVVRQRYRCTACGRTFLEPLADMDEQHATTKRLVSYIHREALRRTFVSVADEVGLAESTVRRIFAEHAHALEAAHQVVTPEWLGIDEIHLGGKPRCVLTNVRQRTVLDLLRDRHRSTVVAFLPRLPDRERVELVAMDMWRPYKEAVNAVLPNATIVVDKFHVLRLANAALERVRKEHRRQLKPSQRRRLMHDRFLLLKRQRDLTPQEQWILEGWALSFPLLAGAYAAKEAFYALWEVPDRQAAKEAYGAWRRELPRELEPAFQDLTTALEHWENEVFAYFDHPITNAYTESLNSLIRLTNRVGRGYSFAAIRAKLLYAVDWRSRARPALRQLSNIGQRREHPSEERPRATLPGRQVPEAYGASLPILVKKLSRGPL
jgi:transposase